MKSDNGNSNNKRGRMSAGVRPVSEGKRIDIAKLIADFQVSEDQGTINSSWAENVCEINLFKSLVCTCRCRVQVPPKFDQS